MATSNQTETKVDAPVPMTSEQKFFFDLRGWILLPSVLSETEIETMKAEVYGRCSAEL